jgi:transcription elongation factor Elf1
VQKDALCAKCVQGKSEMKQKTKTRTRSRKLIVECLACADDVYVGLDPKIGSYIYCNNCDAEFQIIAIEPVLIDWPDEDDYFDDVEGYYDDINDENDY